MKATLENFIKEVEDQIIRFKLWLFYISEDERETAEQVLVVIEALELLHKTIKERTNSSQGD